MPAPTARTSLWDRLWSKVDQSGGLFACWPWTGAAGYSRSGERYGRLREGGRGTPFLLPHRQVLTWYSGPPPSKQHAGAHVCHLVTNSAATAPNTLCCNPAHLIWATRTENELHKVMTRADWAAREAARQEDQLAAVAS